MTTRAIRGATALTQDSPDEMADAVVELLGNMLSENSVTTDALISILFTATPDLSCTFPAAAARTMNLADVPLICAQEINVSGAMPKVVRVMMHVDIDKPRSDIKHVYLRGTQSLRQDLEK